MVDKVKTAKHIYLFFEYCNGGDLDNFIELREKITESQCQIIFRQVFSALKALANISAIHRDIKPANILLHFP